MDDHVCTDANPAASEWKAPSLTELSASLDTASGAGSFSDGALATI